ncbi:MAG: hypothetical protein K2O29_01085 [Ruminococcus sp.]|nr:hypothetical protein [Ruminococcus sp.]
MSDKKNEKKHKKYYLVDYENVHKTGLHGINELNKSDNVIIFYSRNADKLPFSLHSQIIETKAKITYFEVDTVGKNALDFQLATFLGYVLGNNPDTDCHIISNDKGYEYVRSFWKEKNIKIKISSDIVGNVQKLLPAVVPAPLVKTVSPAPKAEPLETDFDKVIKPLNLSKTDKNKLYGIYCGSSHITDIPKRKQNINQIIVKYFGSDKATKYYKAIKPLIK